MKAEQLIENFNKYLKAHNMALALNLDVVRLDSECSFLDPQDQNYEKHQYGKWYEILISIADPYTYPEQRRFLLAAFDWPFDTPEGRETYLNIRRQVALARRSKAVSKQEASHGDNN